MTDTTADPTTPPATRWPRPLPGPQGQAGRPVAVGVAFIAVLTDIAVRPGPATVAVGVLTAAIVVVFVRLGLLRDRPAPGLAAGAIVLAAAVGLRTSPWLVPLDLLAAGGLLMLAASTAGGGRPHDLGPDAVAHRVLRLVLSAARGPAWVGRALRPRGGVGRSALPVVRGLLLAAPIVLVLGLLLASADAVFASMFDVHLVVPEVVDHVAVIVLALLAGCTLATDAASPAIDDRGGAPRLLGAVEAATVLASLVALFVAFAGAQVVTLAGGAAHVLRTAGLTRAEYARTGFFQLLAVAALTLGTLTAVRGLVRHGDRAADRRVRLLTYAAIASTVVVVVVAIGRLTLYVDAFGLSMLRLYTMIFACWIGVVFAGLAATVAGVGAPRRWLLSFAVGTGLAALLALNLVNPEAIVARHNIDHAGTTGRLDVDYLADQLTDDAVPALLATATQLTPVERARLRSALCARADAGTAPTSPWSYNRSRAVAAAALTTVCGAA